MMSLKSVRHSTHNALRIFSEVLKQGSQVPSSYPAMCVIERKKKVFQLVIKLRDYNSYKKNR